MSQIFVYSDKYNCDIGKHVFPVEKYHLLREKLIANKVAKESDFVEPKTANYEDLLLVHSIVKLFMLFRLMKSFDL